MMDLVELEYHATRVQVAVAALLHAVQIRDEDLTGQYGTKLRAYMHGLHEALEAPPPGEVTACLAQIERREAP